MPLTEFQRNILARLAPSRSPNSYLAGGAALHFAPNSLRYSNDLDFFHDSAVRVTAAWRDDSALLQEAGYEVILEISQPGFVRAIVGREGESTRIDWAHDSAWRFMPPVRDPLRGYLLHPIDLAINKTLALAGRDEVRDFVDIIHVHENVLALGGLVWAAVGKDPGFTPLSLLELLKRRGRFRSEELARLDLAAPVNLPAFKRTWLEALGEAERFVRSRPPDELGCLYYAPTSGRFVLPAPGVPLETQGLIRHFGRPGGVLPQPGR